MAARTAKKAASVGKVRRAGRMSDAHKAALAEGREQGQVVRRYLEAVVSLQARRSRKRSPEVVRERLDAIESELAGAPVVIRLQLLQERLDLVEELESSGSVVRMSELEDEFVEAARAYGDRKGISYAAWREIGVSAAVLKRAGITSRSSAESG